MELGLVLLGKVQIDLFPMETTNKCDHFILNFQAKSVITNSDSIIEIATFEFLKQLDVT